MKKSEVLKFAIDCVFGDNEVNSDKIIEKYPFEYEKNVKKSLTNDWIKVGNDMRKAISIYGKKNN